jgi:nitroreductase
MMDFSRSVIEIINERSSWRTYSQKALNEDIKSKLSHAFDFSKMNNPFGLIPDQCRFKIVEGPTSGRNERKTIGTYGFILGAREFIVGAIKRSQYDLEQYGYTLEAIILRATEMGLGTCWLGGTFNKSVFAERINIQEDERLPAITPVGYSASKRRFKERVIRSMAKSKARLPWESVFYVNSFKTHLSKKEAGQYDIPLEMVRLGPSAGNKQPWRIVKEKGDETFHFYLKRTQGRFSESYNALSRLDIGIATCHFDLVTKEMNLYGRWSFSDPQIAHPDDLSYKISWKRI